MAVTDSELCITSGSWRIALPYQSVFLSFLSFSEFSCFPYELHCVGGIGWVHESLLFFVPISLLRFIHVFQAYSYVRHHVLLEWLIRMRESVHIAVNKWYSIIS